MSSLRGTTTSRGRHSVPPPTKDHTQRRFFTAKRRTSKKVKVEEEPHYPIEELVMEFMHKGSWKFMANFKTYGQEYNEVWTARKVFDNEQDDEDAKNGDLLRKWMAKRDSKEVYTPAKDDLQLGHFSFKDIFGAIVIGRDGKAVGKVGNPSWPLQTLTEEEKTAVQQAYQKRRMKTTSPRSDASKTRSKGTSSKPTVPPPPVTKRKGTSKPTVTPPGVAKVAKEGNKKRGPRTPSNSTATPPGAAKKQKVARGGPGDRPAAKLFVAGAHDVGNHKTSTQLPYLLLKSKKKPKASRAAKLQMKSENPAPSSSSAAQVKSKNTAASSSSAAQVKAKNAAASSSSAALVKAKNPAASSSSAAQVKAENPVPAPSSGSIPTSRTSTTQQDPGKLAHFLAFHALYEAHETGNMGTRRERKHFLVGVAAGAIQEAAQQLDVTTTSFADQRFLKQLSTQLTRKSQNLRGLFGKTIQKMIEDNALAQTLSTATMEATSMKVLDEPWFDSCLVRAAFGLSGGTTATIRQAQVVLLNVVGRNLAATAFDSKGKVNDEGKGYPYGLTNRQSFIGNLNDVTLHAESQQPVATRNQVSGEDRRLGGLVSAVLTNDVLRKIRKLKWVSSPDSDTVTSGAGDEFATPEGRGAVALQPRKGGGHGGHRLELTNLESVKREPDINAAETLHSMLAGGTTTSDLDPSSTTSGRLNYDDHLDDLEIDMFAAEFEYRNADPAGDDVKALHLQWLKAKLAYKRRVKVLISK